MPFTRIRRLHWVGTAVLAAALLPVASQAQAVEAPPAHASPVVSIATGQDVAETQTLTGSIVNGDPLQTGRTVRDGREHGCETPTAMPGLQNATPVHADTFVLQNTHAEERCIIVEGDFTGCNPNSTQVNAYSSYAAATPALNLIGASGFSTVGQATFGFKVAANASYTLAVHEVVAASGCASYSIKVTNAPLAATTSEVKGANPAAITPAVDSFRTSLGAVSNRREITWDDVPEANADPANLPLNYYNTTSPQGLVITQPAAAKVSSNGSGAPAEFASLNAGNTARYQPFSGIRMFSPSVDTNVEIAFRIPGTATPAATSAFGAVLVSPNLSGFLVPRDAAGAPLGIYVPTAQVNGLSFYTIRYPTAQIYSMSLVGDLGQGATLGTVFDNFLYTTPVVPSVTPPVVTPPDCSAQKAAVAAQEQKVKKAKKAVKTAKKAVQKAGTPAALTKAKAKLKKAKKKLKKAKAALTKAQAALTQCLG
jgi:hypothetical protein